MRIPISFAWACMGFIARQCLVIVVMYTKSRASCYPGILFWSLSRHSFVTKFPWRPLLQVARQRSADRQGTIPCEPGSWAMLSHARLKMQIRRANLFTSSTHTCFCLQFFSTHESHEWGRLLDAVVGSPLEDLEESWSRVAICCLSELRFR